MVRLGWVHCTRLEEQKGSKKNTVANGYSYESTVKWTCAFETLRDLKRETSLPTSIHRYISIDLSEPQSSQSSAISVYVDLVLSFAIYYILIVITIEISKFISVWSRLSRLYYITTLVSGDRSPILSYLFLSNYRSPSFLCSDVCLSLFTSPSFSCFLSLSLSPSL